ncbi:MAG: chemotaxis protein CheA [Paracoccaceae bacterium]
MSNPADTFRQEASDILESLEENLLELEDDPENRPMIDTVFRALHTIKGSGEMFGFSALAKFVHHLENAFESVRAGSTTVTQELIDISLGSRDHISALLEAGQDEAASAQLTASQIHTDLLGRIEIYNGTGATVSDAAPESATADKPEAAGMHVFNIFFRPEPSALRNGMRPDLVVHELSELGECTATVVSDQVPALEEMDATASYLAWRFRLETNESRDRVDQIFLFFDDGEIEFTEETVIAEQLDEHEETAMDVPGKTEASPPPGENAKAAARPAKASSSAGQESVRVQAYRLDELMDQLGELVIAQARLNRISERVGEGALASAAEEIERLVTGMRDATLSIRMLPIGGVFGKFRRVVRDLASELGKSVTLITEGGETELDKNIIDRLSEPLVHIIRNSMDHGIEDESARLAAGKTAEASLRMVARQTGGEVHISVHDDGGGLNTDKIREKAIERGLIESDSEMSDDAINQLIFAPGFSTADQVSSVSGRGVGMDAVRNFIEDLRGAVEVRSERGKGTGVTLRLPLTLAIIDGLLVRVSDGNFVLPLASVEECVELTTDEINSDRQRSIINIREELVPFINLGEVFNFDKDEQRNRIVIVNADGRRVGLMVDDVIGQHQTVIKSLSAFHRGVEGLAGCTILGDGSVALIIDPAALVKSFGTQTREAA